MATSSLNFAAQVEDWCSQSKERLTAVFRESAQRTVSIAQGLVPVDTGFLRASVRASLQEMPPIDPAAKGSVAGAGGDGGDVTLTIAGAELGQTIFVGYTASYAAYVEYGTSRQSPQPFVGPAAMQWQATVNGVVEELKGRVGR